MAESTRKLGPYNLVSKIGRGAFGVVWLAEKQTSIATTRFALKLSRDEDIDLEAFRQEAAIWIKASGHPNVLPMIDADIYDEQVVIVSEYAPDGSLAGWLELHGGKAPSIEAAGEMIDGVLAGLSHLHECRIIHRDLKPDNILLQRGTPRLADFGISRLLRSGSYSTNISGTLAYMAPEAFNGKRNERTDIWAVGVIFYQLLAGCLPYCEQDVVSLIGALMRHDAPPLPEAVPEVLRRIVAKALERDPTARYASAAEMRRDLREAEHWLWLRQHERGQASTMITPDPEATLPASQSAQTKTRRTPAPATRQGRGWKVLSVMGVTLAVLLYAFLKIALWSSERKDRTLSQNMNSAPVSLNLAASPSPTAKRTVMPVSSPSPSPSSSVSPRPSPTEPMEKTISAGTYQYEFKPNSNPEDAAGLRTIKLQITFNADGTYSIQGYITIQGTSLNDQLYSEERGNYTQTNGLLTYKDRLQRNFDLDSNSWQDWRVPSSGSEAHNKVRNVTSTTFQADIGPQRSWVTVSKL